jgi:O-antigen/teichoic acid export membrane protein
MAVIEGWEFPWMKPVLTTGSRSESEMIREQGGWVFAASISSATLGFAFWAFAARFFSAEAVGTAGALIGLASLATSIGMLGLDNGFIRFASRVARPRALLWELTVIGTGLAALVGLALSALVLTASDVDSGLFVPLVAMTVILTASQTATQITDSGMIAARWGRPLAIRHASNGLAKVTLLFALVGASAVALSAAYTLPMLVITIVSFFLVRRMWPRHNEGGVPHAFREVASLSLGNWLSGIVLSLPSRLGPSIMLIFLGPLPVAYFFIALQLAEVVNYIPEAMAKSLFAHGSLRDRLPASLASSMRRLLLIILLPLVVLGVLVASLAMAIVGGNLYGEHGLALQLFLLATLPRMGIHLYKTQFNVDRRPVALIVMGSVLGASTLAFLVVGVVQGVHPDVLPVAWIMGATLALAVGWLLHRKRAPEAPGPLPTADRDGQAALADGDRLL